MVERSYHVLPSELRAPDACDTLPHVEAVMLTLSGLTRAEVPLLWGTSGQSVSNDGRVACD